MYRFKNSEEYKKCFYYYENTFSPELKEQIKKERKREEEQLEWRLNSGNCPNCSKCNVKLQCDLYSQMEKGIVKHRHGCDCVHWSGPSCGDYPAAGTIGYKNGVEYVWVAPEYQGDDGHWKRTDGKDIDEWTFAPGR